MKEKSLDDIRAKIDDQLEICGPYSHNIIALYLKTAAEQHGRRAANKLIRDCGLDELGWTEVKP